MSVSLARQMLLHDWRRFLPAVLATAFASLLLMMQAALVVGIFSSASTYVTGSSADLWVGYPGTQSVDQGRPIDENIAALLLTDPQVRQVEPFLWFDGDWRGGRRIGALSVLISGIDPRPTGLMFSRVLDPALRAALVTPDTVLVDRAEIEKLGTAVGQRAFINGHEVRIVGVAHGLRALGGVNVVTSLETATRLAGDGDHPHRPTYWVATVADPGKIDAVAARLNGHAGFGRYEAWSSEHFARRSMLFWMFDTGAGAGVLFIAAIVALVGAVISSQTLVAAVVGSVREYATLNALGVGMRALRAVVLEQSAWVGAISAVVALLLGRALIALARVRDVPVVFDLRISAICVGAVVVLSALSGLIALRGLRRADPAVLLR